MVSFSKRKTTKSNDNAVREGNDGKGEAGSLYSAALGEEGNLVLKTMFRLQYSFRQLNFWKSLLYKTHLHNRMKGRKQKNREMSRSTLLDGKIPLLPDNRPFPVKTKIPRRHNKRAKKKWSGLFWHLEPKEIVPLEIKETTTENTYVTCCPASNGRTMDYAVQCFL